MNKNNEKEDNDDDIKSETLSLKAIQTRNKELWKIFEGLHKEAHIRSVNVDSTINKYKEDDQNSKEDTASLLLVSSLQAELDVARSRDSRRSYHGMKQSSSTTSRKCFHSLFGDELTITYNDLVHTNNTLLKSYNKLTEQQQRQRNLLKQQNIIKSNLIQWKENQPTQKQQRCIKKQKTEEVGKEDSYQLHQLKLLKYSKWLRKELIYVSKILEYRCTNLNNTNTYSDRNRRSYDDICSFDQRNEDNSCILSQLLFDLIEKYISANSSDHDPYITIGHIDASIITLLEQCGVVKYHPDDSNYISLVDFTK
jgi:hypothetical protein